MNAEYLRRRFLFLSAAIPAALAGAMGVQRPQDPGQQGLGFPPAKPPKTADEGSAPAPEPTAILKANDKDIKQNVAKLVELAEDLKKQVTGTDSTKVLSLELVHKAEEIEKLARHIASLARGA